MNRAIILFFGMLIYGQSSLQGQSKYLKIDQSAKIALDSIVDYKKIAAFLTQNYSKDEEKIRALYVWVGHNIKYDLEASEDLADDKNDLKQLLKTRKGICQDYSELFNAVSKSIGIESYIIAGLTKNNKKEMPSVGHAWNGVRIDERFYFLDVTWSAGYVIHDTYYQEFRDEYFLKTPEEMIKSHFPFDPIWQFLDNPILLVEFLKEDYSKLAHKGNWSTKDSITLNNKLGKIDNLLKVNQKILWTTKFMEKKEIPDLIKAEYDYNRYSLIVAYLRLGIDHYNEYINHRNRRFKQPKLRDNQIQQLISSAGDDINKADELLKEFEPKSKKDKYLENLANELKKKMPTYLSDLKREENYVKRYLKTWKLFRVFVI